MSISKRTAVAFALDYAYAYFTKKLTLIAVKVWLIVELKHTPYA
jgi:hypothetical protein